MNLEEHVDAKVITENDVINLYLYKMLHFKFIMPPFPSLLNGLYFKLYSMVQQLRDIYCTF